MLALITGADSGIGYGYSQVLSQQGYDLLMVSNRTTELEQAAKQIQERSGREIQYLTADLSETGAAKRLFDYCKGNSIQVDLLVNNAGVFFFNEFVITDIKRIDLMMQLHMVCVTEMCYYFGQEMCQRGHGQILNMSSMSAWMTMPGINVYNATKSYILNLTRSLWYEFKLKGVNIIAVCPGAVDTGLYNLAPNLRALAVKIGVSMPPEKLVIKALKALRKGKKQVVPGAINHLFIPLIKHIPDWLVFKILAKIKVFQK